MGLYRLLWYDSLKFFFLNLFSGHHRRMGTHITCVRSSTLDAKWTTQQLISMKLGGNKSCIDFFTKQGILNYKPERRYQCSGARIYKKNLLKLVQKE